MAKAQGVTVEVPQWVRLACQLWGRQKRRIWSGGDWYLNPRGAKVLHVDGYAQSFLGRVKEERVAAGSSVTVRQHWSEVYWGEGLEVQRNAFGMGELALLCLHLRYVWDPEFGLTARQKAKLLDVPLRAYWVAVDRGEVWIWARLDPRPCAHSPDPIGVNDLALPKPAKKPTLPAQSTSVAELSLAALRRPTLSRR